MGVNRGQADDQLVAAGLLNIVLIAGVVNVISYLAFADANNAGPDIPMAGLLTILAWLSLPLAAGLSFFAVRAYRQGQLSRLVRDLWPGLAAVVFTPYK